MDDITVTGLTAAAPTGWQTSAFYLNANVIDPVFMCLHSENKRPSSPIKYIFLPASYHLQSLSESTAKDQTPL